MQEILSKTVDPNAPLQGQEFYEFACSRSPINSAPDTASGRLTHSGATRTRMSCGKGKRSIIFGFWMRQRSDMRNADSH